MASIAIAAIFECVAPAVAAIASAGLVTLLEALFVFIGLVLDLRLISYVLDAIPLA